MLNLGLFGVTYGIGDEREPKSLKLAKYILMLMTHVFNVCHFLFEGPA